jgi:flavin reductase
MQEPIEAQFRQAMRRMASTVSIISTVHNGLRFGMTATAVASLSAEPPSVLICVNRSASLHHPLLATGKFCINILYAEQSDLAQTFSRRDVQDRFSRGSWGIDSEQIPYLNNAQANVFCRLDDSHDYASHAILIGRVYRVDVREPVNPLLYQDGRYTVGLADGVDWVLSIAG